MSEQIPSIPVDVAKAITAVMAGVKKLGKEDTNKFQKYDFVSVDSFLEATGPLCSGAGLIILQDEETIDISVRETTDDYGKTKTSSWLTIKYAFTFVASSSGACHGPMFRTVMVPANGAQAFGSAQSYALKQFMRAQFQIPTGDKDDADSNDAKPLPSRPQSRSQGTPFDGSTQKERTSTEEKPMDKPILKPFWKRDSLDLDQDRKAPLPELGKLIITTVGKSPTEKDLNRFVRDNDYHFNRIGLDMPDVSEAISDAVTAKLQALASP